MDEYKPVHKPKKEAPRVRQRCHRCRGSGRSACTVCGGSGKVVTGRDIFGNQQFSNCSGCYGLKNIKCSNCSGEGFV